MKTTTTANLDKKMQAIKSSGSQLERLLQRELWKRGHRYRKNYSKVIGRPDIAFVALKIAIFCDSEFWHGYNWAERKHDFKSNRSFWIKKIEQNISRDQKVNKRLKEKGWHVLRFWGAQILKELDQCLDRIENLKTSLVKLSKK